MPLYRARAKYRSLSYPDAVTTPSTILNLAVETAFTPALPIAANSLKHGKAYRITAYGIYGTDAAAPSLNLRLKLNSTTLGQTGAITQSAGVSNNRLWRVEFIFVCATVGSSGSVEAQGMASIATSTSATREEDMESGSAITINTTIDQVLTLNATWNTASASGTITQRLLVIEELG